MSNIEELKGRLTVRPNEAADLLGVSRRSIERALRDGRLRSLRSIGCRLISVESVVAMAGGGTFDAGQLPSSITRPVRQ